MTLDCLEKETAQRIGYAKKDVESAVAHKLLRHNGCYNCDFAGHLLVLVIKFRDCEEHKIRVVDGDDVEIERIFKNKDLAMKALEDLFPDGIVLSFAYFTLLAAKHGFQ